MRQFFVGLALLASLVVIPLAYAAPTQLSVQTVTETVSDMTLNSADNSNGNKFVNREENVFLVIRNVHETQSATATITAQKTSLNIPGYGPVTKSSIAAQVLAGEIKVIGPFLRSVFNDSNEFVQITYTGDAPGSLRVAPLKVSGLQNVH